MTALPPLRRAATHPCLLLPGNSPVTEVGTLLFIALSGCGEGHRPVRSSGLITAVSALWKEHSAFQVLDEKTIPVKPSDFHSYSTEFRGSLLGRQIRLWWNIIL